MWRRGLSAAGQTKNDESQWRWVRPCWTSLREKDENLWRRGTSPAGQTKNDESQWRWVRPCRTREHEAEDNIKRLISKTCTYIYKKHV